MPRRLAAGLLSLLLSVIGGVLVFFGGIVVLAAVVEAVQGERSWGAGVSLALLGTAVLAAGVVFIGRVRPWVVRRVAGVEVPRLPWLLALMWNSSNGAAAAVPGGDGGGAGGGC